MSGEVTYEIGGRGKEGGSEGRMLIFSVNFKVDGKLVMNPVKDDIGVHCECPGGTPRFNIMISQGAYHIGFTPSAGGQHWFDFTYKGTWANEPFCLPIKNKLNKVPDHPYTGASRGGAPATKAAAKTEPAKTPAATSTVGRRSTVIAEPCPTNTSCSERTAEMTEDEEGSFNITVKGKNGDVLKGEFKFDIKFDGPGSIEHKLVNNGDGTYKCTFGSASAGDYRVEVSYKGQLIEKGAWDIHVVDAIASMAIEELTLLVQATDKNGQPKTEGGEADKFKVITGDNTDVEMEDQERWKIHYYLRSQTWIKYHRRSI